MLSLREWIKISRKLGWQTTCVCYNHGVKQYYFLTERKLELTTLIQTLQASIAPCVLISGFGFLILTMSNRLGRSIDRIRDLKKEFDHSVGIAKKRLKEQIKILYDRCKILQLAITMVICSIFSVSLIVLMFFFALKFQLPLRNLIEICFTLSMVFLMFGLSFFLLDIQKGLISLKIELEN